MRKWQTAAGLCAVSLLAVAARARRFPLVFVGDGEVVLRLDESQYHARRALFTFENFPQVLDRDPYINFPQGADVPWPPLHDFALGAAARLLVEAPEAVPAVLAWAPVVVAALTTLCVYAVARNVAGHATALGASAIFALLGASVNFSDLGMPDHHATVAFLATALLGLHAFCLRGDTGGGRLAALQLLLVATRLSLLLSWHGSLMYLALAEVPATLLLAASGRKEALRVQALGCAVTAALLAPAVLHWPPGVGGAYSSVEVSWLHVVSLLAVAVAGGGAALAQHIRGDLSWGRRTLACMASGLLAAGVVAALPGPREGLVHAFSYFAGEEPWIAGNLENQPLHRSGFSLSARALYGGFAYLIPLVPLAFLLRARDEGLREPALILACWSAALAALALLQVRYGSDFAPIAAVGFALLLSGAGDLLRRRARRPRLAALAPPLLGLLLVSPMLQIYAQNSGAALRQLLGRPRSGDLALETVEGSLHRFGVLVGEATPETAGFLDPRREAEYGILAYPIMGHVFQRVSRRPTTADNFGPYLQDSQLATTARFYGLRHEAEAVEVARELRVRYVVSADLSQPDPRQLGFRLFHEDGRGEQSANPLAHFRLVTEGPEGGLSVASFAGRPQSNIPYKLFEIVEGARLRVQTQAGAGVAAQVPVVSPTGREFIYRAWARANERGEASLRLPYSTEQRTPAYARGPYRLESAGNLATLEVSEADVMEGGVIEVSLGPIR